MPNPTNDRRGYYDHTFVYLKRFKEMSRAEFDMLEPFLELRTFGRRSIVVDKGEVDNYLNLVIKGMVRKYVDSPRGEVTLQLATEGHVVQSEISFHKRVPSDVVLQTLEPTVLASIHYELMQQALENIPGAEQLGRSIVMQMFIKKDARYFDQLKMSVRERFIVYLENHPHMLQRVPQKILASYLNIKPETFSRLKHLLLKK